MNEKRSVAWALVLSLGLGCSGDDGEPTPDEIREHGAYCCTHDGEATTRACDRHRPGAVYLEDYSHVDAAGRGDACGWILN